MLNVHPSLLPRWRGAAPVERAILAGDEETGVTIHETVAELDAGPIAAQERSRSATHDAGEVFARAGEVAARLLDEVLAGAAVRTAAGRGDLRREDHAGRPRARPRRPARRLAARSARCRRTSARGRELHGRRVTIWSARLEDGALVPRDRPARGRSRMSYDEFLRGLR